MRLESLPNRDLVGVVLLARAWDDEVMDVMTTEEVPAMTYTLTDAKVPAIVDRALGAALTSGDVSPRVTFGPLTVSLDSTGLWDCTSAIGHASLMSVPTPSAVAWLHHHARGSRVAS
jgi:hypothetical protein